jgi:cytochrome P450
LTWLTFDIIGDLAFGESFDAVKQCKRLLKSINLTLGTNHITGKSHFWVNLIINATFTGALAEVFRRFQTLKILARFLIPKNLVSDREKHMQLTKEKVAARMEMGNNRADFFSHLLSEKATNISVPFLMAQANTIIVAGSETTATALAGMAYYLTTNQDKLACLTGEVRAAFSNSSQIDGDSTLQLPYLCAVIEEGLRIFPPAPFGLQRISPGADVDGHFIPQGVRI